MLTPVEKAISGGEPEPDKNGNRWQRRAWEKLHGSAGDQVGEVDVVLGEESDERID